MWPARSRSRPWAITPPELKISVERCVRAVNVEGAATTYTLTLDYNDGATEKTVYTVEKGTKITLPAPTWEGYEFQGWSDGTTTNKANTKYEVTKEATLTAQWSKIFSVTVQKTTGCTVTASPTSGIEKTTVTLTVTPEEGYELKSLGGKAADNTEVKLADAGEGNTVSTCRLLCRGCLCLGH